LKSQRIIHNDEDNKLLEYIDSSLGQKTSFNLRLIQIIRELLLIGNFNLIRRIFELKKMNAHNFDYDRKSTYWYVYRVFNSRCKHKRQSV
jgi:hypothetical protein